MESDAILKVSNLSFSYDSGSLALEDVSFSVQRGDYVTAIGPNGGGKTTLVKLILGLLKPRVGKIAFNPLYIKSKRDIGYVPQLMLFDRDFPARVKDIVLMGFVGKRSIGSFYSKQDRKDAEDALDRIGMLSYKNKYISELSGGQAQRVLIARAMVSKPSFLLLDEPTNFIDEGTKRSFYDLLKEWNKRISIMLVTHDLAVVSSFAKHILCVNRVVYAHDDYKKSFKSLGDMYGSSAELISHHVLDKHE